MTVRFASPPQDLRVPDSQAETGQWTPETITRFWEYFGERTDLHNEYFSYQVGSGITNFLASTGRLNAEALVLDYGCGPGFLAEKLLTREARCYGLDGSDKAVELVNRKFQDNRNWMGAKVVPCPPAPFPDAFFDLITCLETLEHLLEETLPLVVTEVYRLLKPGGVALFTTPNNEDLIHNHIYCPFCRTSFHKVQHLRSFSEESLRTLVESYSFQTKFCAGIDFEAFQRPWSLPGWRDLNIREVTTWVRNRKNLFLDRVAPRPFPHGRDFSLRATAGPHLCALVERPSCDS